MENIRDRLHRIIDDYRVIHGKVPDTLNLTRDEYNLLGAELVEDFVTTGPTKPYEYMGIYLRIRE